MLVIREAYIRGGLYLGGGLTFGISRYFMFKSQVGLIFRVLLLFKEKNITAVT